MNRYNWVCDWDGSKLVPSEDGEWVRAEDVPQWRPIETAPKDGTKLILTDGVLVDTGFYGRTNGWESRDWLSYRCMHDSYCLLKFKPTHWHPLPTPPRKEEG